MGFFFSVNVYVFIFMVLFLRLKIVKNCQKWVYIGMGEIFFFETLRDLSQNAGKYTSYFSLTPTNILIWKYINEQIIQKRVRKGISQKI